MNEAQIAEHNDMVARLNADYVSGTNERVPITIASDEALWLHVAGESFRNYYTDPRVQLDATLRGMEWCANNIVHDAPFGLPDSWTLAPRWWMDEPEVLGCKVTIQDHQFAWSQPIDVPKDRLIGHVRSIDPLAAVESSRLYRLYCEMRVLADGTTHRDRPVTVTSAGGTHGIFTIAARVRGEERLCLDLIEDPDWAYEYLGAVTDHTIGRIEAWHKLAETGADLPAAGGWGMPDDSLQMISPATYRRLVLPHHQRAYAHFTTGHRSMHLCGFAQHQYAPLYHDLGIRALDGPGPWVDHGQVLADLPELSISAQTDHTRLITGPVAAIEEMMRGMLTDRSKLPGRFSITGSVVPGTPLGNIRAAYDSGVRHGRIG